MTEHGAHHDLSCACWGQRECYCYLWDQDCPNYVDIEESTD